MHQGHEGRGLLITFEGPDGSGKSKQTELLAARLRAGGADVVVTREPGGTPLGERIREIVLHATPAPVPTADALLFNAARAQLIAEVVLPALREGKVVICDRHADSTLAYQGYGYGQPLEPLRGLASFATAGLVADLTVLLDLPVEEGLRRKAADDDLTRFEADESLSFHRRVRDGFLALAAADPDRFVVVDATAPLPDVAAAIWGEIVSRLGESLLQTSGLPESSEPFAAQPRRNG